MLWNRNIDCYILSTSCSLLILLLTSVEISGCACPGSPACDPGQISSLLNPPTDVIGTGWPVAYAGLVRKSQDSTRHWDANQCFLFFLCSILCVWMRNLGSLWLSWPCAWGQSQYTAEMSQENHGDLAELCDTLDRASPKAWAPSRLLTTPADNSLFLVDLSFCIYSTRWSIGFRFVTSWAIDDCEMIQRFTILVDF